MRKRLSYFIGCAIILAALCVLPGCSTSQGDTGADYFSSEAPAAGYTVSGVIGNPRFGVGTPGVACTIELFSGSSEPGTVWGASTTDAQGHYSMSGLPPGRYRLVAMKDGYVTDNAVFTLDATMTVDLWLISRDDWTTLYGADHPYNPEGRYMSVWIPEAQGSRATGMPGVAVNLLSPQGGVLKGYQSRGYLKADGTMDWTAQQTFDTGVATFYGVQDTGPVSIVATKAGTSFTDTSDAVTSPGEISYYIVKSAGQSAKKLSGLCFSPYLRGSTHDYFIDEATLGKYIDTIAPYTGAVRTYTVATEKGMDKVPQIAQGKGLTVAACAYMQSDSNSIEPADYPEVKSLISLARGGNVDIALVGSEATNVGVSKDTLKKYIQYVKTQLSGVTAKSGSPVIVASGLMYGEAEDTSIGNLCDVIFVHVYPCYKPGGIDGSNSAALKENLDWSYNHFKGMYGSKEIIIGEIGWASAGGSFGQSVFNDSNAATHLSTVIDWAQTNNVKFYYFEAYDEEWKAIEHPDRPFESHFGIWGTDTLMKDTFKSILGN
jgi:exo-beta-1,3-glucanase (GH17 family)